MQTLNLCDKCGRLVDRPLIKVLVTKVEENDTSEWVICDFCEEASHFKPVKPVKPVSEIEFATPEEPKRELPKDKRVIRTKSTGDRVYLIDEVAKTKAWVTSAEILEKLGFTLADVEEVDDSALVGYAMTASIYKVD